MNRIPKIESLQQMQQNDWKSFIFSTTKHTDSSWWTTVEKNKKLKEQSCVFPFAQKGGLVQQIREKYFYILLEDKAGGKAKL